jgi:hypothetical protein
MPTITNTPTVQITDVMYNNPTDGVSTLSCWWGLSTPETLRVMAAVA